MTLAPLSLDGARFSDGFEFAFQTRYSFLDAAAIDFQLCFAGTARADSTRLARKVMPHASQSRQKILQLRELDLQPALAAAGALRENVENQLGAIKHLAREQILEVASLSWRKFVIENHGGDLSILQRTFDPFRFAFSDVVGRSRFLQFLRDRVDDFGAGRAGQLAQFF